MSKRRWSRWVLVAAAAALIAQPFSAMAGTSVTGGGGEVSRAGTLATRSLAGKASLGVLAVDDDIPGVPIGVSPVAGSLDEFTDWVDVYSIAVAEGQKVVFNLTGPAGSDFSVDLYGPPSTSLDSGDWLTGAWEGAYPRAFGYSVAPGQGGTYYVAVSSWEGSGNYSLTYDISAADEDDYLPGYSLAVPSITMTTTIDAALDPADIFSIDLQAGEKVTVEVIASPGLFFGLLAYPPGTTDLWIDEPVGFSRGFGQTRTVTYRALTTGQHYVELYAWQGAAEYMLNLSVEPAPGNRKFTEVEGSDRYKTAIDASKEAYPVSGSIDTVVVATGLNWPDALGGAPLAAVKGGPLLLTDPLKLRADVAAEIKRLGASEVLVLGSKDAVSDPVVSELKKVEGVDPTKVRRIEGTDRYKTANKIALEIKNELGGSFERVCFLSTGLNFPDALSASPISAANGWPVLLTHPDKVADGTLSTMRTLGLEEGEVVILGSENAVSLEVQSRLEDEGFWTDRIFGDDRYETAATVADYGVWAGVSYDGVAVATGENFPDALAGGVLQGKTGSALLLTPKNKLNAWTANALRDNRPSIAEVRYLGSTEAVSSAVRTEVERILPSAY